jgi:general stress protein 26
MRDRIQEIGSALFFNTGNSMFKMPPSIISALRVDDQGNIWFFLHKPDFFIEEADKEFPAKLDFYRKGKPFYLLVSGKAQVITDAQEIDALVDMAPEQRDLAMEKVMLVKVQVVHAEYYEQKLRTVGKVESWWNSLCSFVLHQKPANRPYKLHPLVLS